MVAPARYARPSFVGSSDVVPGNGREHTTEPGTAFRRTETKGPNNPLGHLPTDRKPHFADLDPANPPGFGAFVTASETLGTKWTAW